MLQKKQINSQWNRYHKLDSPNSNLESIDKNRFNRFNRLLELINTYCKDAKSVLDLAGNQGLFSLLLYNQHRFDTIIVSDYDENAIDVAYEYFKENKKHITPIVLNWCHHPDIDNVTKRLKSDIVCALAVTHHVILTQKFNIDAIFERLFMYTKKYVVVEFMPLGLWGGEENYPKVPEWYNQEWFKKEFEEFFTILHIEQLEINRVVFIGLRKYENNY
jgi:hypothetical protein